MIQINPKDKTGKDNYKLLSGSVIPRPIAFITSKNEEGIVNAAPFSFFIGEVVMFHFDEAVYQDGNVDAEALDAIGRLAGSEYAKLGRKISIPRPE